MGLARKIFWGSIAGLVHTHVTYPLSLAAVERLRGRRAEPPAPDELPAVSLIVAAFDEQEVIAAKVADALGQEYPRARLELIVASDGSSDRTVELARAAGGDIVAFSDANSTWEPGALAALVAAFADPDVGYACGRVAFTGDAGDDNEEGLYWRYETAVRELESGFGGITAG